eukprot:PhM_4_TR10213/c0_g1_i1/m.105595/K01239/iunH; purine nucleosidase
MPPKKRIRDDAESSTKKKKTPLLFSHDGGIDDYLALLLVTALDNVDIMGICVTPADCYLEPATGATRKILDLVGRSDITVSQSYNARAKNPFPQIFRVDSFTVDMFPILNEKPVRAPLTKTDAPQFIVEKLRAATEKVIFLETGPLTTLAAAIRIDATICDKIEKLVWMGGALRTGGNVHDLVECGHDSSAEWNVYWDADAAAEVWAKTKFPIIMCPLDITNTVRITPEFIRGLAKDRKYPATDLAGLCYSLVAFRAYYCWDVLATAFVGAPDIFTLEEVRTEIVTTGESQGQTKIVKKGGRATSVMKTVDNDKFFEMFKKALER